MASLLKAGMEIPIQRVTFIVCTEELPFQTGTGHFCSCLRFVTYETSLISDLNGYSNGSMRS